MLERYRGHLQLIILTDCLVLLLILTDGDTSHLSMNSHRHRVGVDFFLHQVNPEEQDWPTEYPMAPMDEPVYSTLYTYSTYAFLLQNEVFRHIVPSIHLQVLCKGLREFNENGVRPLFPNPETNKPEELIMYVHSELNLVSFLKELLQSEAFKRAIRVPPPSSQTRVQRIVVPIIMLEHFQAFTWDRVRWVDHITITNPVFIKDCTS